MTADQEATSVSTSSTNEASAMAEILKWSADCPVWQRDALRRLCTQEKLVKTDIDELLEICKGTATGLPLSAIHLRDPAAGGVAVKLGALYDIENVNALASGERLTFGQIGITVIYGDNGAGKSGYARVLKHLCRARTPKDDVILPNIYAASSASPKASIEFYTGGQKRTFSWTQGSASDAMLTAVSVFDSRTANVHVDNTNDLAYTPFPLKVLATVAQTCQDLKAKLNAEIKALEEQTPSVISSPQCKPVTAVGKLMSGLSAKTKPEKVEELSGLNEEENARLEVLQADLSSDPARTARQLQSIKNRLDAAIIRLGALESSISNDNVTALRNAASQLEVARAAAAAASADLFSTEPLHDVGSPVWKELWEAARSYSRESAYPDQDFPVTNARAKCVLCHQDLSETASKRLKSFEAFVQDESKRREDIAQNAYSNAFSTYLEKRVSISDLRAIFSLLRDELNMASLSNQLRREALAAAWRLRLVLRTLKEGKPDELPRISQMPIGDLQSASQNLTERMTALLAEENSLLRANLIAQRDELADRKWLSVVKVDVLAQIQRLNLIAGLAQAVKETVTTKITNQSAIIAPALVTNRLRGRFAKEVDKLGVAGLAVELQQTKTTAGIPYFQVRLINKPTKSVGAVLSEGEHRCVALAAFLAELATVEAHSTIVFDDPVSSLDHLHRDKVAARLAEEGRQRQVIVFTHDIAFLLLLDEACRQTKDYEATQVSYRLISRGEDATGYCLQEPPSSVMPIDKVVEGMRNHLRNVKILHSRGDQAKWHREVISFQDQLRTTWERAVEDIVSPVIKRLGRKVETIGLLKLTVLTPHDCSVMRDAFSRCSKLLHSQPGELNPPLPTPSVIESEIDALAGWITDIRNRQSKVA